LTSIETFDGFGAYLRICMQKHAEHGSVSAIGFMLTHFFVMRVIAAIDLA
jgi:hypothetical protein